jgi:hypothetical protein
MFPALAAFRTEVRLPRPESAQPTDMQIVEL